MKKHWQFLLISLIFGIGLTSISYAGQKEVKLIGVEDGNNNEHLCADIIGDSVVIGAHRVGIAKIYVGNAKQWKEQAELTAEDHNEDRLDAALFGWAVSISAPHAKASGNIAIVGAPKARAMRGAAYIFVRDGNAWKQQTKLVPQDLAGSDAFGGAVFVHGNTAIVGANGHTHNGLRFAGAAYVFVREGKTWVEQAKLTADDAAPSDSFEASLAMSGDTIVIGAPLTDTDDGRDAGSAYIFGRDGDKWQQQAKVFGKGARKGDKFGSGVATNGNIAIIGAPIRDEGAPGSGAVYSFVNVDGVWEEKEKVLPDDEGPKINFGAWVAMSGDMVVVSAHNASNEAPVEGGEPLPRGLGSAGYVYNGVEAFGTLPFAMEPFGLKVTSLAQVKRTVLYQNFPNPFNPETWLPYRLADDAPVTLRIYNSQGQLTREFDLGVQKAGSYLSRETAPIGTAEANSERPFPVASISTLYRLLHSRPHAECSS